MDDLDLQAALGGVAPPDAADSDAATDLRAVLSGDVALEDAPLAAQDSPEADADEGDLLAAQADDEDEPGEDEDALRRELDELRQAKREAEAEAEEARNRAAVQEQFGTANRRLAQGVDWFVEAFDRAYDKDAFLREHLPRVAQGYANDIAAIKQREVDAAMALARKHGTNGWLTHLTQHYGLSEAELSRVRRFPPEQMEEAARLIADTRAPIAQQLTTTKSQLTKAQRAIGHAQRSRSARGEPGSGRAAVVSLADVQQKITGADEELGPLLRLMGMTG